MRILGYAFLVIIILTSCKQNSEQEFDIKSLPTEWVKLTKTDTGLVIFNSCDAGNLIMTITKKDNKIGMFMHGQQEDYTFEILKAIQTDSDTVKINTKLADSEDLIELKFFWIDKTKGLEADFKIYKWYCFRRDICNSRQTKGFPNSESTMSRMLGRRM